MDYSKEYYKFYECYNFVMGLAWAGVIKDIESLKQGIMFAYGKVEGGTEIMKCPTMWTATARCSAKPCRTAMTWTSPMISVNGSRPIT